MLVGIRLAGTAIVAVGNPIAVAVAVRPWATPDENTERLREVAYRDCRRNDVRGCIDDRYVVAVTVRHVDAASVGVDAHAGW